MAKKTLYKRLSFKTKEKIRWQKINKKKRNKLDWKNNKKSLLLSHGLDPTIAIAINFISRVKLLWLRKQVKTSTMSDTPTHTSRYICNDKHLFSDLQLKSYKFVIVGGEIIRSEEVGLVHLLTHNGIIITLNNIAYIPRSDSNLILLGQFFESEIIYHDHLEKMILKQRRNTI